MLPRVDGIDFVSTKHGALPVDRLYVHRGLRYGPSGQDRAISDSGCDAMRTRVSAFVPNDSQSCGRRPRRRVTACVQKLPIFSGVTFFLILMTVGAANAQSGYNQDALPGWAYFVVGLSTIIIGITIYYLVRSGSEIEKKIKAGQRKMAPAQTAPIIKTYKGSQAAATALFQADAVKMAARGYFPTGQSWGAGQWGGGAFVVAILLIFLFGLGILILAYLLIVRPPGTLTITYEYRVPEKICPACAEPVKAAAIVCRFCGYRFDKTAAPIRSLSQN